MKLRLLVFICFIIVKTNIIAMDYIPRVKVNYATFNMLNLKHLQDDILLDLNSSGIDAIILDDYPNILSYQFQFLKEFNKMKLGFYVEFSSTGSRIDYRDYSGNYTFDQILSHYSLGIHSEYNPIPDRTDRIIQYFQISLQFNTLKLNENVEIFDEELYDSSTSFVSHGFGFDTGFNYILLRNPIVIMLDIGGHFSFSQTLHLEDKKEAELYSSKGKVSPNWSGFRFGIIIGYSKKIN